MKRYQSLFFNAPEFSKLFEMKTGVSVIFKPPGLTAFKGDTQKVQQATALVEDAAKLYFPLNVEHLFGPPVLWQTQQVNQAYTILSRYNPRPNGEHFIRFNTNARTPIGVLTWTSNPTAMQEKIAKWESILQDVAEQKNPTITVKPNANPLSLWLDLKEFELHNSSIVRHGKDEWLIWAETQGVANVAAQRLSNSPLPLLETPQLVTLASPAAEAMQTLEQAINKLMKPEDTVVTWAEEQGDKTKALQLLSRLPQVSTVVDKINSVLEQSFAELVQVPTTQQTVDTFSLPGAKFSMVTLDNAGTYVFAQADSPRTLRAAKDQALGLQRPVVSMPKLDLTAKPAPAEFAPKIDLTKKKKPSPISFAAPSPPAQRVAAVHREPAPLAPKIDLTALPKAAPPTPQPEKPIVPPVFAPTIDLTARAPSSKPAVTVLPPKQRKPQQVVPLTTPPVQISAPLRGEPEAPVKLASVGPISIVTDASLPSEVPRSTTSSAPASAAEPRSLAPPLDLTKTMGKQREEDEASNTTTMIVAARKERPKLDLTAVEAGAVSSGVPKRAGGFRFGAQFTCKLDVPSEYVGKMIGRGGSGMREIESQTNARVKFNDEEDISVCTISAQTERDMQNAEEYIRAKLAQFEADDADYSSKRGGGGAPPSGPRRRNAQGEMEYYDNEDDFTREGGVEDADGFIDHFAPIVDPEFMKRVWAKHEEDPRKYTNEVLAVEFNVSREDLDPIMILMRYRADYIKRNAHDEDLMDDSYEKLNCEHMGVYTPEEVTFDQMPRPFLTPKYRFVRYDSELACKNYHFATNTEEVLSHADEYIYLPGVHLEPKPKPQKIQEKTTTVDGWLINRVTKDNRNYRNLLIKEWTETGAERRRLARVQQNAEILNRDGLIQVGHGKFRRVGHYTPVLRGAVASHI